MGDDLRLKWALLRNRLIASRRVRGLASWFPPARVPARRYARELFDLTAGFVYTQVTRALIESGLLASLGAAPMTTAQAAARGALSLEATDTLLKAAAALELTERVGDRWLLGRRGAALAASPGVAEMVRHHGLLYADIADPLAMLRGQGEGRLARLWRYDGEAEPTDVADYSALMAASQPMVAEQAIGAYDFSRHKALLDIGGGSGAFLNAVACVTPNLRLGLFDRPLVIDHAQQRLGDRVTLHAGDFIRDPIPTGYDLISLVRVLHDHDDGPANHLLSSVHASLPPHGRLVIVEPLADTSGAEPVGHAYFGMYLAAMGSGRPRTWPEYKVMLARAGFRKSRKLPTTLPLVASVILAQR